MSGPVSFGVPGYAAPVRIAVVGGGVAGGALAYFASLRGAEVILVDAGEGAASTVPAALINPVRGQGGTVDPDAVAGAKLTWQLVGSLVRAGHSVPHGRTGVRRPVPGEDTRRRWAANLPPDLEHAWLEPGTVSGLADGWHAVLDLPLGGWLDGAAFCAALRAASGAQVVSGWAAKLEAGRVTLEEGDTIEADRVIFAGGSVGASRLGWPGQHRAGSVLLLERSPVTVPLSFGVYATPAAGGGVLGASFEAPSPEYAPNGLPSESLAWLLAGAGRLLRSELLKQTGSWTGSRLSTRCVGRRADGTWALTGLGSKGFLLGPLLARRMIEALWPSTPSV